MLPGHMSSIPDPSYKMGPRAMPSHVPTIPDQSLEAQRKAKKYLKIGINLF